MIARLVAEGDVAHSLILGEGSTSRLDSRENANKELIESLHKNTLEAARIIGYEDIFFADFPDNRFDSMDLLDIIKKIEYYVDYLNPEIVFTHHSGDLNIDHQITAKAVLTASRPIGSYSVKEIYAFETVSSTEWSFGYREKGFFPNVFFDISDTFETKCDAMRKYTSELRDFPHPRSIEMLESTAKRWGAVIGKEKAEAFELIRKVV